MKEPLISVIVPVYKVEQYINRCVDSIINQTYKNLEIILVDDGSPDNCPKICDEYALKDSRIKVVHKENGGLPAARNTGVENAKGDYITFVDSDDWIDVNMYSNMISKAGADIDIIRTEFIKHDGTKVISYCNYAFEKETIIDCKTDRDKLFELIYNIHIHANIVCMLVKKELIDKIYPFDTSVSIGEDLLVAMRLFSICDNILFLPESYYYYYKNPNSLTLSLERTHKNIEDLFILKDKIVDILHKYGHYTETLEYRFKIFAFIKTRRYVVNDMSFKDSYNTFKFLYNYKKMREVLECINFNDLRFKDKVYYILAKYKLYLLSTIVFRFCN